MARMTKYLQSKLINHSLGKQAYTMPTMVYLAFFTRDPGELGVQTYELDTDGYARIPITADMSLSEDGAPSINTDILSTPALSELSPLVTHCMIVDDDEGGNGLYYAPISPSKTVPAGQSLAVDIGLLSVTLD